MEKFVLSGNLVQAIQNYLIQRPFKEVANIVLALQQQIAPQLPPEQAEPAEQPAEPEQK